MRKPDSRTRSVGTKITEADYLRLQLLAGMTPMSEWIRGVLLAQVSRVPLDEAVVAEVMAVRSVVLSALQQFAPKVDVKTLAAQADANKTARAQRALKGEQ